MRILAAGVATPLLRCGNQGLERPVRGVRPASCCSTAQEAEGPGETRPGWVPALHPTLAMRSPRTRGPAEEPSPASPEGLEMKVCALRHDVHLHRCFGRFQNKEDCNWDTQNSPDFSVILYTSCLSTYWVQCLDWALREPTVTGGERCVPRDRPESRWGWGRGHQNGVQEKGDLICGSREKESRTWKGFLEEVAFTLGLEETKKCGFFNMGETWVVCQLCWQVEGCQTHS